VPPNGLAFSCRRGAQPTTFKKPTISRAEGGQLQRRVRRSGRSPSGCEWHVPTTPSWYHAFHNGCSVGTTHIWNHARHNGPQSEPRASGITLPRTSFRHNGRSYYTGTTRFQHNGHSYHTLHNEHRHDGADTTSVPEAEFAQSTATKGMPPTLPGRRTVCRSAAASALPKRVKKRTISRAQRSAATACSALRSPSFG